MQLFLLFLLTCFVAGILLRDSSYRQRLLLLLALSVVVTALYYGLDRLI